MRSGGTAAAVLVIAACGSRTGFEAELESSLDASVVQSPASDAGAAAVVGADARVVVGDAASPRDAAVRADAATCGACDAGSRPFLCGGHVCASDDQEYCLTQLPGCGGLGAACASPVDCCIGACIDNVCGGPDAGASPTDSTCAELPPDCRTSPPTCACVLAHAPCGPDVGGPLVQCRVEGGVLSVSCPGI
jgi:hypothetical protein